MLSLLQQQHLVKNLLSYDLRPHGTFILFRPTHLPSQATACVISKRCRNQLKIRIVLFIAENDLHFPFYQFAHERRSYGNRRAFNNQYGNFRHVDFDSVLTSANQIVQPMFKFATARHRNDAPTHNSLLIKLFKRNLLLEYSRNRAVTNLHSLQGIKNRRR